MPCERRLVRPPIPATATATAVVVAAAGVVLVLVLALRRVQAWLATRLAPSSELQAPVHQWLTPPTVVVPLPVQLPAQGHPG